jgi:hypothetical protein
MSFLIFKGPSWENCGQSQGQAAALTSDQNFQQAVTSQYQSTIGTNTAILNDLSGGLENIFNAGPNQQGDSPAELAVQNSQAINSAAAENQQVQAAIGENAASHSAVPGVESGIVQAEKASAATQIENNLSNQEASITQQNYDIGRDNFKRATAALISAPGQLENPINQTASIVNNSNSDTGQQANANAAANQQWLGVATGVLGDATKLIKPFSI